MFRFGKTSLDTEVFIMFFRVFEVCTIILII